MSFWRQAFFQNNADNNVLPNNYLAIQHDALAFLGYYCIGKFDR